MNILHLLPSQVIPAAVSANTGSTSVFEMFGNADLVVKLVLFALIGFSVASWTIIFIKFRYFRNAKHETAYFLDLFWDSSEISNIYKESKELAFSPVARMFQRGYAELLRIKKLQGNGNGTEVNGISEAVERSLKRSAIHESSRMEKMLAVLATTGNTAPFIGLFGTVWGIMESFTDIGAMGSASFTVVAPGIAQALIATAVGLAAAIPAVMAYNFFSSKAGELETEMEVFSADFLSLVVRQSIKNGVTAEL